MVTRIRRGARAHLYIAEHREAQNLTLDDVAGRLEVARNTVWRWENEQHRLNPQKIAAIAHALNKQPEDLWRLPTRPSLDAMLHNAPDELHNTAADIVRRLTKRAS